MDGRSTDCLKIHLINCVILLFICYTSSQNINECETPGTCSQLCYDTKDGYKCDCYDGYILEPDNIRRCRVKEGHPVILFVDHSEIRIIDPVTSENGSIVSNLLSAVAIDYDYKTRTIVWSDIVEEAIKSAPIDTGTPVTTIISNDITIVDGIAVDWIYGHIYWTDTGKDKIEMVDKTGKIRKTIIDTNLDQPRAIVLDPLEGWLYWTDWGENAKIERAGMDGSHRCVIVSSDIKWPNGLAIDFVSKKIFWADAKLHILGCADYNGDNQRVVLSSPIVLKHPYSIDVFEDWVYWTDWGSKAVHRINKFNGNEKEDIAAGKSSLMDIHIYHQYKQPEGTNYCQIMNALCSHLCLPTPNITIHSARYTCACPDGMKLMDGGTTCIEENSGKCANQNCSTEYQSPNNRSCRSTVPPTMGDLTAENLPRFENQLQYWCLVLGLPFAVLGITIIVTMLLWKTWYRHKVYQKNNHSCRFSTKVDGDSVVLL